MDNNAGAGDMESFDQRAVIKVCGIGGGGGNAVERMIAADLDGVEFITINTDAQALKNSKAGRRIQIGSGKTEGLGAGAKPGAGREAAEEDREAIREAIRGSHMVFLTAGLGGGTGTGAVPIVAEEARSADALTVAIVTLPFSFEGVQRMENALAGLMELEEHVDTLIVVPNDRVAEICENNMSLTDAFKHADEVLYNGVRAISELITVPGLINLDFADVRTIMQARGRALMGIGISSGEDRAAHAADEAIICPLLDQRSIDGAMGVIVNIKGGKDIRMKEVQQAVNRVKDAAHPGANIIFGCVVGEQESEELQVTVIAAGFPTAVSESYRNEQQLGSQPAAESDEDSPVFPAEPQFEVPTPPVELPPFPDPVDDESESDFPEEQYLFPEDVGKTDSTGVENDADDGEDLGIPAFLRRRMRKKK